MLVEQTPPDAGVSESFKQQIVAAAAAEIGTKKPKAQSAKAAKAVAAAASTPSPDVATAAAVATLGPVSPDVASGDGDGAAVVADAGSSTNASGDGSSSPVHPGTTAENSDAGSTLTPSADLVAAGALNGTDAPIDEDQGGDDSVDIEGLVSDRVDQEMRRFVCHLLGKTPEEMEDLDEDELGATVERLKALASGHTGDPLASDVEGGGGTVRSDGSLVIVIEPFVAPWLREVLDQGITGYPTREQKDWAVALMADLRAITPARK